MRLLITALATALLVSILPAATSAQTGIGLFDVTPTPTPPVAPATSEPTSGSSDPVKPVLLKTIPIKDITAITTAPLQAGASLPADAPNPQIVTTKPDLIPQIVNPLLPSSLNPAKSP
jgi:hypothetical protein